MVWETHDGRPSGVSATASPDYAYSVQDETALAAVPASQRADKQVRYVETEKTFYTYDDQASSGNIQPGDSDGTGTGVGNGWWLRHVKDDIEIAIRSQEFPYRQVDTAIYAVLARFTFRGTSVLTTPKQARFILWAAEAGGAHYARLYDVTNANVIAEVGPFSVETITVQTDSSLVNLPTGQAVFEVQTRDANGKKVNCSGVILVF